MADELGTFQDARNAGFTVNLGSRPPLTFELNEYVIKSDFKEETRLTGITPKIDLPFYTDNEFVAKRNIVFPKDKIYVRFSYAGMPPEFLFSTYNMPYGHTAPAPATFVANSAETVFFTLPIRAYDPMNRAVVSLDRDYLVFVSYFRNNRWNLLGNFNIQPDYTFTASF